MVERFLLVVDFWVVVLMLFDLFSVFEVFLVRFGREFVFVMLMFWCVCLIVFSVCSIVRFFDMFLVMRWFSCGLEKVFY